MASNELIGFVAGIFVAVSVLPQVVKSWKTRSTKDIAISWSIINLIGQLLWILYGVVIGSWSLVIMSAITTVMNISMIVLKLKYG